MYGHACANVAHWFSTFGPTLHTLAAAHWLTTSGPTLHTLAAAHWFNYYFWTNSTDFGSIKIED